MPYKIVNTIERGKAVLTCVPSNWEKNGTLFWPPKGQEKLRHIESSVPELNWKPFNFVLKRRNIGTVFQAEHEINMMCAASETDDTENEDAMRQPMPKINMSQHKTFEAIAQECILDNNDACETEIFADSNLPVISIQEELIDGPGKLSILDHNITLEVTEGEVSMNRNLLGNSGTDKVKEIHPEPENAENTSMLKQEMLLINTKLDSIIGNQQILSDTQQQIILCITKLSVQFEQVIKNCDRHIEPTENTTIKIMDPINSLDDLIKFEQELVDRNRLAELKKKYSAICGIGKGRGMTNAYQLIDHIFDRNFLMKCSWAGGSRSQEEKICFKSHSKIINFFFDIVHDLDNTFTLTDCFDFFKNILKNSKKRMESGGMRTSATKNRPKMKKIPNVTSNIPSDETSNVASDETLNVTPEH